MFRFFVRWFRGESMVRVGECYLGRDLVTQGQWKKIMGNEPWKKYTRPYQPHYGQYDHGSIHSSAVGDYCPAIGIDWDGAMEFCKRLSAMESRTYRLPMKAELDVVNVNREYRVWEWCRDKPQYNLLLSKWEFCQDEGESDCRVLMSDSRVYHIESADSILSLDTSGVRYPRQAWFGFRLVRTT